MNKFRFIALSISLIFIVNADLVANKNHSFNSDNSVSFSINDLSKKKYYEDIFNKSERKQLKKAGKYLAAAKKYLGQYDSDKRQIERLYTIAEATSSAKSREKSLKKARKLETKALKKGLKAISYYNKATDIKTKIYSTAINRVRLNDDTKNAKLGRDIELEAKNILESAKTKERTAPRHDDQLKFNVLREANEMKLRALSMQETAFGLYKNDPSVKIDDINIPNISNGNLTDSTTNVVNQDSVLFPVYVEQYNPLTDPNLYRSKANIILPRLNLRGNDLNLIVEANRQNQVANDLLRQVDESYLVVDSLNFVADRTEDFYQRDQIRTRAIEKEQNAFYKLNRATNIYLNVNETRYRIYKKYFPKIDPNKQNSDTQRAKRYQTEADDYFLKAKGDIARAKKLMYKSDQYLKLMGANELLLYSLQLQESAYGIYFNMPEAISTVIDTSFISENEINNSNVGTKKENTSNLNWSFLSRYTYSKAKPKPVRYKNKKGIVFLIQVGIFKGLLPPAKFATIQPLIFDKFVKNPYRRYMAGEYKSYEAAQLALSKVKSLGYTDAFLISFVDGQRKSLGFGQSRVNTADENYTYLRRMETARINGEKFNNTSSDNYVNYTAGGNVTNTKGLLYFVQLGMFSNPVSGNQFKNLQPIFTHNVQGKGTRYLLGTFAKLAVARAENQRIKSQGFKDSYVSAYYNGQHISLDRAKKLEKQQYGTISNNVVISTSSKGNIIFMVQVGAYSQTLSGAEENKLRGKFAPRNVNRKFAGGMNVYTVGNYKTYKDADYLKRKLIGEGHKGVFVVAFEGNNKIPVGEAIKKQN